MPDSMLETREAAMSKPRNGHTWKLIVQTMAHPTGHPASSFSALEILGTSVLLAHIPGPSCTPGIGSRLRNAKMKKVQLRILENLVG